MDADACTIRRRINKMKDNNDEWSELSESLKKIAVAAKETGISTEEFTKSVDEFINNLINEDLIDFIDLIEINPNLSWWQKIKIKRKFKKLSKQKRTGRISNELPQRND